MGLAALSSEETTVDEREGGRERERSIWRFLATQQFLALQRCVYTIGQSHEIACRDDLPGRPARIKWHLSRPLAGRPAGYFGSGWQAVRLSRHWHWLVFRVGLGCTGMYMDVM
jgi:hypothetical protein